MKKDKKQELLDNADQFNKDEYSKAVNSFNAYCSNCKQNVGRKVENIKIREKYFTNKWQFKASVFILLFFLTCVVGAIVYVILYFTIGKKQVERYRTVTKQVRICPICRSTLVESN